MAGFNNGFDPNNPQNYDYHAQQQRLALQQALAKQMGQGLGEGRMVGGWYAAPSKGAYLVNALQQALGGYMQVKGLQDQEKLDKNDREAFAAAREAYAKANDPANYIKQAQEAYPIPSMQPRTPPTPDTPIVDNGPMDPTMPMQTVQVVGKREAPSQEEIEKAQTAQAQFLQRAMAADREKALERMGRTNRGGPLAQAIMARDYAPPEYGTFDVKNADGSSTVNAWDKRTGKVLKLATGSAGMTPYQQAQLDLERQKAETDSQYKSQDLALRAGEKGRDEARSNDKFLLDLNKERAKVQENLAETQSGIATIEKAMGLASKWNATGGPLSSARMAIGKAVGEKNAYEYENALNAVAALNIKIFGPNPSNADREAIQRVVGAVNMGKAPTLSALNNLYERARAAEQAQKAADARYGEQADRYQPKAPTGRPSGYGQSVTSPADILNSRF